MIDKAGPELRTRHPDNDDDNNNEFITTLLHLTVTSFEGADQTSFLLAPGEVQVEYRSGRGPEVTKILIKIN